MEANERVVICKFVKVTKRGNEAIVIKEEESAG